MTQPAGPIPPDGPFHPLTGDRFRFACHPQVACFNACCADLTLALTPYDIVRLRKRLGLNSGDFLDQYTEDHTESGRRFPGVKLKMTDGPGRPCPFVTRQGCGVYEDRPGACRTYPLGRGSASGGREIFFVVREDHCRGFEENREWVVAEWLADQGLEPYNRFNDLWMEIITAPRSMGPADSHPAKLQMFSMVSYNLDRFKEFVFGSRFLAAFNLPETRVAELKASEEALLTLGFQWLRFALFGEKTLPLRADGVK